MPAVQLIKLQQQTAELAGFVENPVIFVAKLRDLLEFYADRTQRPGQSGEPLTLLPTYHVPSPVLRQTLHACAAALEENPQSALALCDALWSEQTYETCLLALNLLGRIPATPPEPLLARARVWGESHPELPLLDLLLSAGLATVRAQNPQAVLDLAEGWLESSDWRTQQMGLRTVYALLDDARFQNLPRLFRLLAPLVASVPGELRPDLLLALRALILRSPAETAYFLRQALQQAQTPQTLTLVRKLLLHFAPAEQTLLREALQAA
ncbi:MAG: hypothetical protein OHK0052_17050 [Anaerolineales bacterium]